MHHYLLAILYYVRSINTRLIAYKIFFQNSFEITTHIFAFFQTYYKRRMPKHPPLYLIIPYNKPPHNQRAKR